MKGPVRFSRWLPVPFGVVLLCAVAVSPAVEPAAPRVLALVNDQPITEAQVLRRLKAVDPYVESHRADPNRWRRLIESGTEAAIRDRLMLQAATTEGLAVTPEELAAALTRTRELLGEDGYAAMLARQGASQSDFQAFLERRMLIDKFRAKFRDGLSIDDETLRDYYRGHKDGFVSPERLRLETVEVGDVALADQVKTRLQEGAQLATLRDLGDDVRVRDGWVARRQLPAGLQAHLDTANPGDVVGPLETAGRFRVVRVAALEPSRKLTFQEARDVIRERLLGNREQHAVDSWYEQAKRAAKIEYP